MVWWIGLAFEATCVLLEYDCHATCWWVKLDINKKNSYSVGLLKGYIYISLQIL